MKDWINKSQDFLYHYRTPTTMLVLVVLLALGYAYFYEAPPKAKPQDDFFRVSVKTLTAKPHTQRLFLYGTTTANRLVNLRAETSSPVKEILVEKGNLVKAGDILMTLDPENRPEQHEKAKALLKQRALEHKAAKKLVAQAFKSETKLAEAASKLADAKSALVDIENQLKNIVITAPFDGVLEDNLVEVGDYARTGDMVAKVVELSPLKITTHVSEHEINQIQKGAPCSIRFPNGAQVAGKVIYVSTVATPETRTFPVEIQFENTNYKIKAGMTAEVGIVTSHDPAHFLSPAYLNLDDTGVLGVKSVDAKNRVLFFPVQILDHAQKGLWVKGLPEKIRLITVGQDYVTKGQQVIPVEDRDK